MDEKIKLSWEDFLNPDIMRLRLISASIYIAAFEVLKDSIINRIRKFFLTGFDESGDKIDPKYISDVLSRNRSPVYASLDWLKEMGVIDETDINIFNDVKVCRNTLAHCMLSTLSSKGLPPDFENKLIQMINLLHKIEMWWIVNVEIPINPDLDDSQIEEDDILPGPIIAIQLLMEIALGDKEKSRKYYEEFKKGIQKKQ